MNVTKYITKDKSKLIHAEPVLSRFHNTCILNITSTPKSHVWTPRLIKKYIQISEKYKYWNLANPNLYQGLFTYQIWGLKLKYWLQEYEKCMSHDQPLWAYSILLNMFTQMIYHFFFLNLMKKMKLSNGHQTLMILDWYHEYSSPLDVMARCHQASSHYLSQCWHRSPMLYGVTGAQGANLFLVFIVFHLAAWIISH